MEEMPMKDMPMKDMPMKDMPMKDMPMKDMSMKDMPMMNMPMMNMPMMNMPMDDEDDDLKSMYPKIYLMIYPMVKHHCDMIESSYGTMYCPGNAEMDHMCKEVCDKYEKHHRDDDDEDIRDTLRQGRRGPILDLTRILFINDLLGRRRRRRMFDHEFDHEFDHGHHNDHGFHHGY